MSNSSLLVGSFPQQPTSGQQSPQSLSTERIFNILRLLHHWILTAHTWSGRYAVVIVNVAIIVVYLTLLRVVMVIAFADMNALTLWQGLHLFITGLRFDLLVALCFAMPQIIHFTVVSNRRLNSIVSHIFLEMEWLIGFLFLPFLCIAEYLFFEEFQSRLNYLAFEYIVYPTEVCCNIWQSYPVINLLAIVGIVGGILWILLRRKFYLQAANSMPWRRRYGFLFVSLSSILVLWMTSGVGSCQISRDRVANECSWNGLYSFVYYAWTCRLNYDENYITLDEADATQRLRQQVVDSKDILQSNSSNPVDRIVVTGTPQRNYNVVLILEESLGSDFIGVQGDDRRLTPHFDALSREGILLDNFYATGNRTARALEAVLTSMPPIPTEAILKRDHSDRVFTLAHVLAERGYERLFMTGGRGLFDGVRSFMTANGFNRFVEKSDFKNPLFSNAWGVSDEDLFRKALGELDKLNATGKPFFATLLTVSNHKPFTFPEGRIPQNKQSRSNAVRYADWALGYFFREAKEHNFYHNTIFVVMGDHGARVYGSQLFPMSSYRVPALIIHPNGNGKGTRCNTLACAMDIAPTIMGLLGGEYRSIFFGYDALTTDPAQGRVVMQHNHDVALLNSRNHMIVLGFGKTASYFQLDKVSHELEQKHPPDTEMQKNGAALFQSAFELYYADRWFPEPF